MSAQAATVVTSTTPLWYATRATGVVSLVLLTTTIVLGILQQTRAATERWPRLVVSGIHRNISLLVCVFLALHIVTAEADTFAPVGWWAAAIPFLSAYRPLWLGFGTVSADLLLALIISSLLRTRISPRIWRLIHWAAYLCWPTAVIHGLGSGTDARSPSVAVITLLCAGVVLTAAAWRLASNWRSHTAIRTTLAVTGLASVITTVLWALAGPLAPGWSAKADTPTRAGVPQAVSTTPTAPVLPVSATVAGTVQAVPAGDGRETVTLAGTAGADVFKIAISGPAASGGGVRMDSSTATFGTSAAPGAYSGRVTALDGDTIQARLTDTAGAVVTLVLTANINGSTLTGTLQAAAGG